MMLSDAVPRYRTLTGGLAAVVWAGAGCSRDARDDSFDQVRSGFA
jgi:hypothetical protein